MPTKPRMTDRLLLTNEVLKTGLVHVQRVDSLRRRRLCLILLDILGLAVGDLLHSLRYWQLGALHLGGCVGLRLVLTLLRKA